MFMRALHGLSTLFSCGVVYWILGARDNMRYPNGDLDNPICHLPDECQISKTLPDSSICGACGIS